MAGLEPRLENPSPMSRHPVPFHLSPLFHPPPGRAGPMDDRLHYGAIVEGPVNTDWRYLVLGVDPKSSYWCHLVIVGAPTEDAWRIGEVDGAGTEWVRRCTLIEPGP